MTIDLNTITTAIGGSRGDDQQRIAMQGVKIVETLLHKNADYGGSVFEKPVLCPEIPPRSAILVRMSDKIARLRRLATNAPDVAESIDDTMRDLAGYAILWLCGEGE